MTTAVQPSFEMWATLLLTVAAVISYATEWATIEMTSIGVLLALLLLFHFGSALSGDDALLTAADVHKMGLEQNAQIEARMDGLLKKQGLSKGTVGERMSALSHDKRFVYPDTDAGRADMIAYLNKLIAQVRLEMPKLSRLKLKAPVIVKRVPPDIQDGAGLGYMNAGALDGSRPSTYYINLKDTANWPRYSLPTLTHHETIPGHAWQGAYLTETGKLLRRQVVSQLANRA